MLVKDKLNKIQELVNLQTDDLGLWCISNSPTENYIQTELRRLHAAIEADTIEDIDKLIQAYKD